MTAIGFRFSSSDYSYCIISGSKDSPKIEKTDQISYPKNYTESEILSWLYQEISTLTREYQYGGIGILKAETNVPRSNSIEFRIQCDAIAVLLAAQCGCNNVARKVKATIAKDLGLKGTKKALENDLDTSLITDFEKYSSKIQEAVQVAWSCI